MVLVVLEFKVSHLGGVGKFHLAHCLVMITLTFFFLFILWKEKTLVLYNEYIGGNEGKLLVSLGIIFMLILLVPLSSCLSAVKYRRTWKLECGQSVEFRMMYMTFHKFCTPNF